MKKILVIGGGAMGRGISFVLGKFLSDLSNKVEIHIIEPNLNQKNVTQEFLYKMQFRELERSKKNLDNTKNANITNTETDAKLKINVNTETDAKLKINANTETDANLKTNANTETDANLKTNAYTETDANLKTNANTETDANLKIKVRNEKLNYIFSFYNSFDELSNNFYDLIIEATFEDIKVKLEVFKKIQKFANSQSIIASNTSCLSVTEMAEQLPDILKSNTVGLHFFNPPHIIKLVEIINTKYTSFDTIEKCKKLVARLSKVFVISEDKPGFIANRMGIALINEALSLLEEGVAVCEDIDKAMVYGFNSKMGPIKTADFVGLDIILNTTKYLFKSTGFDKYKPNKLLIEKVNQGKLGVKTKEGFYVYNNDELN